MAAGFGLEHDVIGHDVRGLAAVNHAHVAGALAAVLLDQPVPAFAHQLGDRQRSDGDRADPLFRRSAGMAASP